MTRLWDKGAPLDERVLRFTAGEDHALDNRLVAYDVRASIAHAEMLHECGLLAQDELDAIRNGLTEIAAAHARGEWSVTLDLEDGQTALETLLTRKIGTAGARLHAGRSRNDQVLTALRLYLRDAVEEPGRRRARTSPRRSTAWRQTRARSRCLATRTCSRRCRARSHCGRRASPRRSATTSRACVTRIGASARIRSVPPRATARPTCR